MSQNTPHHNRIMVLLSKLGTVEKEIEALAEDVDDLLNNPLDEDDLVLLLYARDHKRTKSSTEDAVEALRSIGNKDTEELITRLAAAYGGMTLDEAAEFVDDLYDLRDKYGPSGGSP